MCRIVAYMGEKLLLEDVLVNPKNSIVMQSLHARESDIPTNGDGFGLGWYMPEISDTPALFRSVLPAWNDRNLLHLSAKTLSPTFFAHVRAASAGGVSHDNCHPFVHDKWMLMHNGGINQFPKVKRHLRHLLDDDLYSWIGGETDSEHLFALFLQLAKGKDIENLNIAGEVLIETLKTIENLVAKYATPGTSYYNLCLTNGKKLIATRFCTGSDEESDSLHYTLGSSFHKKDGVYHIENKADEAKFVLVASEMLNDFKTEWQSVPVNSLLTVDENFLVTETKIIL